MEFAVGIFVFSLAGIAGLFTAKEWELRRGRALLPAWQGKTDEWAHRLDELLVALKADLEKLPPEIVHLSRLAAHEITLAMAALLRFLSTQTHKLADYMSPKYRFERRAPRSEFLSKVMEVKNGNGKSSDIVETEQ